MNRTEMINLLSVVAAADRRTIGQTDVKIWLTVLDDIPAKYADQAVLDHLREEPGVWLQPGHVYQRARALMRDQLEREPDTHREARQAALEAKAAEETEEQRRPFVGTVKHHRPQSNWLLIPCPHCGAGPMNRCTIPGTTLPPSGGTHPARLEEAVARGNA